MSLEITFGGHPLERAGDVFLNRLALGHLLTQTEIGHFDVHGGGQEKVSDGKITVEDTFRVKVEDSLGCSRYEMDDERFWHFLYISVSRFDLMSLYSPLWDREAWRRVHHRRSIQ